MKVGAAPLTMKCPESDKVRHELTEDNDDDNPLAEVYRTMQAQNDFIVAWLNSNGLSDKHMVAKVNRKKEEFDIPLTAPKTKEQQQQIVKAKSHGQLFMATQGSHFGTNNMFHATEMKNNEKEIAKLEQERKNKLALKKRHDDAIALLEKNIDPKKMQKAQLEPFFLWHGIQNKYHPKGNAGKVTKWLKLVDKDPPPFVEWEDEEEDRLIKLKSKNIDIEDTALGRAKKTVQHEVEVQFGLMTVEAQLKLLESLKGHKKDDDDDKTNESS